MSWTTPSSAAAVARALTTRDCPGTVCGARKPYGSQVSGFARLSMTIAKVARTAPTTNKVSPAAPWPQYAPNRQGWTPPCAQPIDFFPSMASRMMSACPVC